MSAIAGVFDDLAFNARVFARELLVAAVLVAGAFASMTVGIAVATSTGPDATSSDPNARSRDHLPPTQQPTPVLPTDGVSYMHTIEGEPFTVDCDVPVVIQYDANGAPYDAQDIVRTASDMFSAAIGRSVIFELGYVDFTNSSIGDDFTIGIGWTGSLPSKNDGTDVLGQGGPITRGTTVVGGHVALAADTAWPAFGAVPGSELGVVLHELGHVAGLGHAEGGQMESEADEARPPGFSPAEIAALNWIFTSSCINHAGA